MVPLCLVWENPKSWHHLHIHSGEPTSPCPASCIHHLCTLPSITLSLSETHSMRSPFPKKPHPLDSFLSPGHPPAPAQCL